VSLACHQLRRKNGRQPNRGLPHANFRHGVPSEYLMTCLARNRARKSRAAKVNAVKALNVKVGAVQVASADGVTVVVMDAANAKAAEIAPMVVAVHGSETIAHRVANSELVMIKVSVHHARSGQRDQSAAEIAIGAKIAIAEIEQSAATNARVMNKAIARHDPNVPSERIEARAIANVVIAAIAVNKANEEIGREADVAGEADVVVETSADLPGKTTRLNRTAASARNDLSVRSARNAQSDQHRK
jgi:hypothetical protein